MNKIQGEKWLRETAKTWKANFCHERMIGAKGRGVEQTEWGK